MVVIYPEMNVITRQQMNVESWGGYNHNLRIPDGDSWDETNMSADEYPLLAPRKKRGVYQQGGNYQGLIAKDNLCWVDGPDFVMNGYHYQMNLSTREKDCPKQLVSMGAYVVILPDKKYINTANTNDMGNIEAEVHASNVRIELCDQDGGDIENTIVSDTEPEDPVDGQYWVDTGSTPNALKQWSNSESMWVEIGTTYARLSAPNIGAAFADWDGVKLAGWESSENAEAAAMMGSQIIWHRENDSIVITGIVTNAATIAEPLTVKRWMPDMDFVIESGNRLWGCKYGVTSEGTPVNEIYACKLGDFKNWNVFLGLSTDAWVGNLGTDGQFTGAANYLGYPLFFKADHIHRVYGNMPSQYSIKDTVCRGVQKGSAGSVCQVNEVLIYKSRTGICVYDGSLPRDISDALGQESYSNAVAGAHGDKYYISMVADSTGEPVLMSYDAAKGIWHKEDGLRPMCFCSARNELYCIDSDKIRTITGGGAEAEGAVHWETITGEIGLKQNSGFATVAMPEKKRLCKLMLRIAMEAGASVDVSVEYNGDGNWVHLAQFRAKGMDSFAIPIIPRRCEWLRLKIQGVGDARIYSLTKYIEGGSDVQDHGGTVLDF